jgi:alpha-galactosidase
MVTTLHLPWESVQSPQRELEWRKWVQLYSARMLPKGRYRGELYDIGFDKPETHVVEKDGRLHYAFYAEKWNGLVTLRGLEKGAYTLYDYVNEQEVGRVNAAKPEINLRFAGHLLIEARPI